MSPFTPALCLVLEPLPAAISQSVDIVGFSKMTGVDKVALCADDTLLFLGETSTSLVAAMSLIST